MTNRLRAALGAALLLPLFACGSDSASGRTIEVSITDEGCDPFQLTAASGSTTFHVKNNGADSITEFEVLDSGGKIIGEKESLTPGLEGTNTIDLAPGSYTLACPGGTAHPTGTLTVSDSGHGASGDAHGASGDASGCVPNASSAAPTTHLAADLSDFKIELAQPTVASGAIALDATNKGTHPHEIVVVQGVAGSALPVTNTGQVDEDSLPDGALVGELEAFSPGRSCSTTLALSPGTYALFCNVQGEEGAHFKLGMVTTLTVS